MEKSKKKILLIDGNSIANRAFYAIMGSKILMTDDGLYTNAIYGFLSILFKTLEEEKPEYLMVSFDLRAPTHRHKLYKEYKAKRKGMPEELRMQMPVLKEILRAMNIKIIEKEGYEADDILGTVAKWGQKNDILVKILTGDKDSFQLISDNINVIIPRTKMGKTETENIDINKIKEIYLLNPKDLIEVKSLMGDPSDNIPGVPGVGEKTALDLIQKYKTLDNLYNNIDKTNGKLKEKLEENKEMAYLSHKLGTIDVNVPIEEMSLNQFLINEWNKEEVFKIFKKLKFNRYIEKFNLSSIEKNITNENNDEKYNNNKLDFTKNIKYEKIEENEKEKLKEIGKNILENKIMFYFLDYKYSNKLDSKIKDKKLESISIYLEKLNTIYYIKIIEYNNNIINNVGKFLKDIFENKEILKISYKQKDNYIVLKQYNIEPENLMFDIEIAAYLINANINKYEIEYLSLEYLKFDTDEYLQKLGIKKETQKQINLFEEVQNKEDLEKDNVNSINIKNVIYVYIINKLYYIFNEKLKENNCKDLFDNIEMPLSQVLADMEYKGIKVDKNELILYGKELKEKIDILTHEIYELVGEEFNINSPKQLRRNSF